MHSLHLGITNDAILASSAASR